MYNSTIELYSSTVRSVIKVADNIGTNIALFEVKEPDDDLDPQRIRPRKALLKLMRLAKLSGYMGYSEMRRNREVRRMARATGVGMATGVVVEIEKKA